MDGCLRSEIQCPVNIRQLPSRPTTRPMTRPAGEAIKVLEAMGECVSEMKMVNLRPYITAVDAAALDLQKELQEKATLLITPTPGTDRQIRFQLHFLGSSVGVFRFYHALLLARWVESFLDEDDERARASMSSSKARRSADTCS
uniref:Uncharacterized protein n=1 Tax=Physcomitrium patens TaxID=3218 RepID=A9S763_PHYPA|nr:hypothetical protein PHYPA_009479 [Physcomitrium patens]